MDELPWSVHAVVEEEGPDRLDELPGIGADLAGKIAEIVRTGTLGVLEELQRSLPPTVTELMRVPGLGPRKKRVRSWRRWACARSRS